MTPADLTTHFDIELFYGTNPYYILSNLPLPRLRATTTIVRRYLPPHTELPSIIQMNDMLDTNSYYLTNKHIFDRRFSKKPFDIPCYAKIGPSLSNKFPFMPNYRDPLSHEIAIVKRVFHETHFNHGLLSEFKKFVTNYVHSHYTPLEYHAPDDQYLDEHWLNDADYTVAMKKQFHLHLALYNTNQHDHLFYKAKSFVKKEFYDTIKYPRCINGRSDMFKTVVAPYIKDIEHQVIYNEHFIKGKLPSQVTERMTQISTEYDYIYETDYSSFEGSFTAPVMDACENVLFKYMLQHNPVILKHILHCPTHINELYCPNFTFKGPGSRLSGDQWTSLANGFTNNMLFLFMCHQYSKNHPESNINYDYIFEGDDGFFGVSCEIDTTIAARLGFTLKLERARDISNLSFCGLHPMPSGLLCPDIYNTLLKFGFSFDPLVLDTHFLNAHPDAYNRIVLSILRAKAHSCYHTSRGVPILQAFAIRVLELTQGSPIRTSSLDWWDVNVLSLSSDEPSTYETFPILDCDRTFVFDKYGIDPQRQILIEQSISQMSLSDDIVL